MIDLKSYIQGEWRVGSADWATLVNPSTEESVARTSTAGFAFGEMVSFARTHGLPALAAMTFRERGEMLRALSKAIHAHRDELLGLGIQNGGNTRSDAKFDVDGASGTLMAYADLGVSLGDRTTLVDGEAIQLGRSARLFGQHIYSSRPGVAVHINAFNFPAWGTAEKAACALLAGMPVISKPATSTALVAFRLAEICVASGALPKGAFTFVAGGTGDLFSHLGGQDVLAFTGSSKTGAMLRGVPAVVEHGLRLNVEADSLNAAVLGHDVEIGGDTFQLFLADVVRDMTQKTGQKCTAIRRIYVPKDKCPEVLEAIKERLSSVTVGDPSRDDVQMGPVATANQFRDVRAGIENFAKSAKVMFGASDAKPFAGQVGSKGFFVSPTLFFSESPSPTDPMHQHEVFGPVAVVMAYDGTGASAAKWIAAGGGGLVASVYSDDKDFLRAVVLGSAAFNGRLTIGSAKIAGQAIPPGTVLPSLVHGGPGRAGGGEELGGVRGLAFYMQRTALQGDRPILELFSK